MRVLNIGSLNLDHVYNVDHIITPGETEATGGLNLYLGGKGINQSIALAKAGVRVCHGGLIGDDGQPFLDACEEYGVDARYIRKIEEKTGHTVIQIDKHGQNSILLYGGANQCLTEGYVDEVLADFASGDILLLQNEVNLLPYIVDKAYEKGMVIALNPSPYNEKLEKVDMTKISIFLLNEVEAADLCGADKSPEDCLSQLITQFPQGKFVLTLGCQGCLYRDAHLTIHQPACPVQPVDTTAAGDTFTGFFIAGIAAGEDVSTALEEATKAAAIAISRKGAAPSIPSRAETLSYGK